MADDSAVRIARAWRELRRGAHEATLRAHLLGPGGPIMEQAQLDGLEILAAEPDGRRMSEFADAMRVDPSTATRAVDRLERMGLAERVPHPNDRRVITVRATPLGTRTVKRVMRRRAGGMERLLEGFDDHQREDFAEQLETFVDAIDRLVAELARESAEARRKRPA